MCSLMNNFHLLDIRQKLLNNTQVRDHTQCDPLNGDTQPHPIKNHRVVVIPFMPLF